MRYRSVAVVLAVLGLVASGLPVAAAGPSPTVPVRTALGALAVRPAHSAAAYHPGLFDRWRDDDGDGCDTRNEVLLVEAVRAPLRSRGCVLSGGSWFGRDERRMLVGPSSVRVDSTVPLAEAYRSGAYGWDSATRARFANDRYAASLRGMSKEAAAARGSRDAGSWLPAWYRCAYLDDVVAVKRRWGLSVDATEKAVLARLASWCPNTVLTVPSAAVRFPPGGSGRSIFYVGDSLAVGTRIYLPRAGLAVTSDAAIGRTTTEGLRVLARRGSRLETTVIADLGTNDSPDPRPLRTSVLGVLGRLPWCGTLFWLTSHRAGYARNNAELRLLASRDPRLHVLEEADWASRHLSMRNGVHYTAAGYAARAAWLAGEVTRYERAACYR